MPDRKRWQLALNECEHGHGFISLDDQDGAGTRLTSGRHCGRYTVTRTWPLTASQLLEARNLFDDAADEADA